MSETFMIAGTDLATLGVGVQEEEGLLDMAGLDYEEHSLRGRDLLIYQIKRRSYPQASLTVLITGATAAASLANWQALKKLISPAKGWQSFTRSTVSGRRLLVRGFEAPHVREAVTGRHIIATLVFDRYPFWQDATEGSQAVPYDILPNDSFDVDLSDWDIVGSGGTLTRVTSPVYEGAGAAQLVTTAGFVPVLVDAIDPSEGNAVIGSTGYALNAMMKGAAGAEAMKLMINWYDAAGVYLSQGTANAALTTAWARYYVAATSPWNAAYSIAGVSPQAAAAYTLYVDSILHYSTAAYTITAGDVASDVVWTCEVRGSLAGGLWFETPVGRCTYTGALIPGDVLVCSSATQTVLKNGVSAIANMSTTSVVPSLLAGANAVTTSAIHDFVLTAGFRARYE